MESRLTVKYINTVRPLATLLDNADDDEKKASPYDENRFATSMMSRLASHVSYIPNAIFCLLWILLVQRGPFEFIECTSSLPFHGAST